MNAAKPMPTVFFGHGNPMNALDHNAWTDGWAAIGAEIPRPKAILSVSAHWYISSTLVTAMPHPETIHDFGGFPKELYEVLYPAPGSSGLAARVQGLFPPGSVGLDEQWGIDHGTWSVLCHAFPKADIPVVQLSIDATKPPSFHYAVGKRLAALRDEGVLVMGTGNLVHNLMTYAWGEPEAEVFEWAAGFEQEVRRLLLAGRDETLIHYEELGCDALLSAPTPDHYLPLLYVLALRREGEHIGFPVEGFDGGSISMLTVRIG